MAGGRRRHETARPGRAAARGGRLREFCAGFELGSPRRRCARRVSLPMWLWGAHGSGKTHLLQAVCASAARSRRLFSPGPLARDCRQKRWPVSSAVACYASTMSMPSRAIRTGRGPYSDSSTKPPNCGTRLIFAAACRRAKRRGSLEDWRSRAAACVVYQLHELDDYGTHRGAAAARGAARPAIAR